MFDHRSVIVLPLRLASVWLLVTFLASLVCHAVFMHGVQGIALCAYTLHFLLLPVVWRAHAPILPGGDAPLCAAC
jgi:hypothetical protein